MGENLYCGETNLLCTENSMAVDDLNDDFYVSPAWPHDNNGYHIQDPIFSSNGSNFWIGFPSQSDEEVKEMVEVEKEYMPREDYLERLRSGNLDLRVRREALDWILKVLPLFSFFLFPFLGLSNGIVWFWLVSDLLILGGLRF